MRKVLITGGPTSEPIDEVMRIITFASGSLSVKLANLFLEGGDEVCLVVHPIADVSSLKNKSGIDIFTVESTDEMMAAIQDAADKDIYDAVLHTAAVGDYKSEFTFLLEDIAEEIFSARDEINTSEDILKILTDPKCKLRDDSKISSYQENLTVKLTLTPKIIARLRSWFPDAVLVGCKLLENVPREELFQVAKTLCQKNEMDFILANDLAELRKGNMTRYAVDTDGFIGAELISPEDIYSFVRDRIVNSGSDLRDQS